MTSHPAICLNMIVRNESHVIREGLDSIAPYISSWVIVDTGSNDGTQAVICEHMAALGIPGELHQRPWRDFGHNRTEALNLAQGRGDYIWVMDADDIVVGTPDFTGLDADAYLMRIKEESSVTYWRLQLFRDGARVRYVGVIHEVAECEDDSCATARLEGRYHIESRRLGGRNLDPRKHEREAELLLAAVENNPEDARSVFYLAQTYSSLGDFASARRWYARRVELGGWAEEVYYAMYRLAWSMDELGEPWPEVEEAYLRAWEFRPTRAESLYAIAWKYRTERRFRLGYLFARPAAEIPYPEQDVVIIHAGIYAWRAADQLAVCASQIGEHTEAFTLCRRLLARTDIPDDDRQRIATNRDFSVPAMLEAASCYPEELAHNLIAGSRDTEVTVSLIAGPDRTATEQTLNSFLNTCTDISRAGRFLVIDTGLSAEDRTTLESRYQFVDLINTGPDTPLPQLREQIHSRFWLHLGQGWRFFAPENYLTRLTAVLDAEPQVFQVAVNYTDATELTGSCAPESDVRRTSDAGRYVLTDTPATGPAMTDTTRPERGGATATLDEVLCISAV